MSIPELCNEALQAIGTRTSIASIDEDSNEARQCRILFDRVRKKLLRAAPWGFAKATVGLSLLKALPGTYENPSTSLTSTWLPAYPPPGWLYSYAMPTDCLRVRYVIQNDQAETGGVPIFANQVVVNAAVRLIPLRFTRGTDLDDAGNRINIIATNARNAIAVYNPDITDDTLWDADFREAFVCALAVGLAPAVQGDKALVRQLLEVTNLRIVEAQVADANEGLVTYDTLGSNIAARELLTNYSFADQFVVP